MPEWISGAAEVTLETLPGILQRLQADFSTEVGGNLNSRLRLGWQIISGEPDVATACDAIKADASVLVDCCTECHLMAARLGLSTLGVWVPWFSEAVGETPRILQGCCAVINAVQLAKLAE